MNKTQLLTQAKPILFNTEMVQAILDERKTQTRRIIKPQPEMQLAYIFAGYMYGKWSYFAYNKENYDKYKGSLKYWSPPCHTGDILYVRETWNRGYIDQSDREYVNECWFEENLNPTDGYIGGLTRFFYKADNEDIPYIKWHPSIYMPKDAARIFLKVTNVRVEKLQDITDEDAEKEGFFDYTSTANGFFALWNKTIKKSDRPLYGWTANPWIWVIEFERLKLNESRTI